MLSKLDDKNIGMNSSTYRRYTKSIDLHCDTLLGLHFAGESASLLSNNFQIDLHKLNAGGVDTQVFAVFVPPASDAPLQMCLDMIDRFYCELDNYSEYVAFASTSKDIIENRRAGKISALLALEDSGIIGSSLSNLRLLHRLGVRIVTLTWNNRNPAGSPNIDAVTSAEGLTDQGFEFVDEMVRLGMLVDVSHLSDAGFWDVSRTVSGPFIASHSNVRSITNHNRNLTDDMIRSIAEHGGIIGANFYGQFLTDRKPQEADISDLLRHINHLVKVGGIDCVALGSDFDGMDSPPIGLENSSRLPSLFEEIEKAGYNQSDIDKISSGNAFRVISEVCK